MTTLSGSATYAGESIELFVVMVLAVRIVSGATAFVQLAEAAAVAVEIGLDSRIARGDRSGWREQATSAQPRTVLRAGVRASYFVAILTGIPTG